MCFKGRKAKKTFDWLECDLIDWVNKTTPRVTKKCVKIIFSYCLYEYIDRYIDIFVPCSRGVKRSTTIDIWIERQIDRQIDRQIAVKIP